MERMDGGRQEEIPKRVLQQRIDIIVYNIKYIIYIFLPAIVTKVKNQIIAMYTTMTVTTVGIQTNTFLVMYLVVSLVTSFALMSRY